MIRPGPNNRITDVEGIAIGNAQDQALLSGTTVILPDRPAVMAVDVRGGGPGTRDTDALDPTCMVETFHGVVLSGGSVFGLAAADGVTGWLSDNGIGLPLGPKALPVVPSAILFDLANGGDKNWGALNPYPALGIAACNAARKDGGQDFALGNAGAGMGATAGVLKGGLGTASATNEDGFMVGALVAANPAGQTVMPGTRTFWAWGFEQNAEFGGQSPPNVPPQPGESGLVRPELAANTTIGVVATDAMLTKSQARRIAIMAHDGMARAIRPLHTPFDGDTVFVISTGKKQLNAEPLLDVARLGEMGADCVARAIARSVYEAAGIPGWPAYRDLDIAGLSPSGASEDKA